MAPIAMLGMNNPDGTYNGNRTAVMLKGTYWMYIFRIGVLLFAFLFPPKEMQRLKLLKTRKLTSQG